MRRLTLGICLLAGLSHAPAAQASYDFYTNSTATQRITSPAVGGFIDIKAVGQQHFVIDTVGGTASVTSLFQGNDLLGLSYNLYNTTTPGTVVSNGTGGFTIRFHLLFELDITSGPPGYLGLQLFTKDDAIFQATNVADFPFLASTAFGDPNRPADAVSVYNMADGSLFGSSSNRLVTINSVVPEPSSFALWTLGTAIAIPVLRSRGRARAMARG